MTGFSNILVGVDLHQGDRVVSQVLRAETEAAIRQSIELAGHSGGTVTLATVLEISPQTASLIERDHKNMVKTVEDFANEMLDSQVALATSQGVAANKVVKIGSAWEELSKLAIERNCDLIVVGTRCEETARRILFGSTAQKLIRMAPCPVWVVKPDEYRDIREIAVATDLGDESQSLLHTAVMTARALNARLYVLHIVEQGPISQLLIAGISSSEISDLQQKLKAEAETKLQSQLALTDSRTLQQGVKVEVNVGSPDQDIGEFVSERLVDLLIIGTHGRSGFQGILLGNTAERVLPTLHASLLAIKPTGFKSPLAHS